MSLMTMSHRKKYKEWGFMTCTETKKEKKTDLMAKKMLLSPSLHLCAGRSNDGWVWGLKKYVYVNDYANGF